VQDFSDYDCASGQSGLPVENSIPGGVFWLPVNHVLLLLLLQMWIILIGVIAVIIVIIVGEFISLIHQQSYQTVAAKGIRHADGKASPTGTYSFPDKLSLKTNIYSLQTTTTEK